MTSRLVITAILIQCCLHWLSPSASATSLQWIQQFGSIENSETVNDTSADAVGNVYISGTTYFNFGPNFGDTDSFVSKYDSAGELIWNRQVGSPAEEGTTYVSSDRLGNAYLAGNTNGDLGSPNAGASDVFLKKFDAAGNLQWSRQFGTGATDRANAISTDESGNIYIAGQTLGQLGDTYFGSGDAFISRRAIQRET